MSTAQQRAESNPITSDRGGAERDGQIGRHVAGRARQAAKTPLEPAPSDQPAEPGKLKPRRPQAKRLPMSKEAQIWALREREVER